MNSWIYPISPLTTPPRSMCTNYARAICSTNHNKKVHAWEPILIATTAVMERCKDTHPLIIQTKQRHSHLSIAKSKYDMSYQFRSPCSWLLLNTRSVNNKSILYHHINLNTLFKLLAHTRWKAVPNSRTIPASCRYLPCGGSDKYWKFNLKNLNTLTKHTVAIDT